MLRLVFDSIHGVYSKMLSPLYRSVGKSLYVRGLKLEGDNASEDRLVPSLRNLSYEGNRPDLEGAIFVAPNATVVGNVRVGANSSIWYGATLVGTQRISIGDSCIIQDRAHLSRQVKIGNNVFVGPNSVIQGSELADNSYVSMGATVRHAKVESGGLVAAGAVIPDNIVVKQGQVKCSITQIWAGNPGRLLRNITPIERQVLRQHLEQVNQLATIHAQETQKSSREVISGMKEPYDEANFEDYVDSLLQTGQQSEDMPANPLTDNDEEFIERRVGGGRSVAHYTGHSHTADYEAYEYNIQHMGEKFNLGVHQEEFGRVATKVAAKQRFESDQDPWTKPY